MNSKPALALALLLAAARPAAADTFPQAGASPSGESAPLLFELYTSQGCVHCPKADELFSSWGADAFARGKIIPLAYHVDYWDWKGWKDPFGSAAFSQRQRTYGRAWKERGVYTPMIVVDGRFGFVGSDRARAEAEAAKPRAADRPLALSAARQDGRLELKVSVGKSRGPGRYRVMLAIFENGLLTEVPEGENSGRRVRNDFVVRGLAELGRVGEEGWKGEARPALDPAWKPENCGAVVFLQEEASLRIDGVASVFPLKK